MGKEKRMNNAFAGVVYFMSLCWKSDRVYIILLCITEIIKVIVTTSSIIFPRYIIDSCFVGQQVSVTVAYIAVFVCTLLFTSLLLSFIKERVATRKMLLFKSVQLHIGKTMMNAQFERIESCDFLDTKAKAERFLFGDGSGFATVLDNTFALLGLVVTLIILAGVIMQLHISVVVIILLVVIINTYINYKVQKSNVNINIEKSAQERQSMYYSAISQDFRCGKEIRNYNLTEWILKKYDEQLLKLQQFYKRLAKNNRNYDVILAITSVFQQIASYSFVVVNAIRGLISVGQFSMFLTAIVTFSNTLKNVASLVIMIQQYSIYYEGYKKYIGTEQNNQRNHITPNRCPQVIEFINVSFKYKGQNEYALKNVNMKIRVGERIMILGENGAGKSTFVKLLMRLYEPTAGRILLDGININEYKYYDYNNLFSTVFQDYSLFSFSVRDNIVLSDDVNEDKLDEIVSEVGLSQKVSALKKGGETYVYREFDNEGFTPSGGEGQKIAMCRAAYKDSPITILDEPTASLDPNAESELYEIFDTLFSGKTCIYISHRLAAVKLCNRVVVFSNGEIIEDGKHEELMNTNGMYSHYFNIQANYYK